MWRFKKAGEQVTFHYDADDRIVTQENQRGAVYASMWDGLNRLIETKDPADNLTTYKYDRAGNLVRIEQNEKQKQRVSEKPLRDVDYDARGRAILITDSFGRCYGAVYDERDLILERTDALGRTTNLDFGLRRELLAVVAPVEPSITATHEMQYDRGGRIDTVQRSGR